MCVAFKMVLVDTSLRVEECEGDIFPEPQQQGLWKESGIFSATWFPAGISLRRVSSTYPDIQRWMQSPLGYRNPRNCVATRQHALAKHNSAQMWRSTPLRGRTREQACTWHIAILRYTPEGSSTCPAVHVRLNNTTSKRKQQCTHIHAKMALTHSIYLHRHTYMCMYVCTIHTHTLSHKQKSRYIHACIHTYIHTHVKAFKTTGNWDVYQMTTPELRSG
mgnify:CR=1 FL=1